MSADPGSYHSRVGKVAPIQKVHELRQAEVGKNHGVDLPQQSLLSFGRRGFTDEKPADLG